MTRLFDEFKFEVLWVDGTKQEVFDLLDLTIREYANAEVRKALERVRPNMNDYFWRECAPDLTKEVNAKIDAVLGEYQNTEGGSK